MSIYTPVMREELVKKKMALQRAICRVGLTLFLLLCLLNVAKHTSAGAVRPCKRWCGAIEVPFPFGLASDDPSCSYPDTASFSLTCNTSFTPPKLFNGDFEVIDISVDNANMRTWWQVSYDCYSSSGPSDSSNWYLYMSDATQSFSHTDNIYVAIGCDTKAYIDGLTGSEYVGAISSTNYTGGCMSSCESLMNVQDGDCSGIGCCQNSIPKGFRGFQISIESRFNHSTVLNFNPCSFAFLVQKNNYTFKASDLKGMSKTQRFPIVFDWYVGNQSCELAMNSQTNYACISDQSYCINSTNGPGYLCRCSSGYHGNPYILNGCQDINECEYPETYPCKAVCTNTRGSYRCTCPPGTDGDPITLGCHRIPTKHLAVIGLSIGISSGLVTLMAIVGASFMRKKLIMKKLKQTRDTCFKRNHDLLLRQVQLYGHDENIVGMIKFFSLNEMDKATDNFDVSRIVGDGGHGVVYKGLLDLQVVAIKKSKVEVQSEKVQFINEIILLSQISHRNIVKLIGCCLQSEVPVLVYEFVSNGSLASHLHCWNAEKSLSWDERLRIATEISSGLAYMHTKANVSIYHRDVKSSNILLDDSITAKISDFGASKSISLGQTHVSTQIQGTPGYLDPEYIQTGQLTEKSDVYSLGVILVELITGETASSNLRAGDDKNMIGHFLLKARDGGWLLDVVDDFLLEEANTEELKSVANLALACLNLRSNDRPMMREIELTLEGLIKGRKNGKRHERIIKRRDDKLVVQEPSIIAAGSMTSSGSANMEAYLERHINSKDLVR